MSKEFDNVVIFVSDALRYDRFPNSLKNDSEIKETLAPSLHTPTSFASILTGISPENHNVRGFMQELDPDIKTCFQYFENSAFYDGPETSSVNEYIAKTKMADLFELEEPFIWVERMLDTHAPYGKITHERDFEGDTSGRKYIEKCKSGELDIQEEYANGVKSMEKYVKNRIKKMKEKGMLENTLVIITSDHGEALGERFLGRKRYDHNYPPMREIAVVPTVFYNYDLDIEGGLRSIDIIPTALSLAGKDVEQMDGRDLSSEKPENKGINLMEDVKADFKTEWRFDKSWKPTRKSKADIMAKTAIGDLKRDLYQILGRPLKNSVEEYFEEKGQEPQQDEELEGIDI